MQNTIEYFFFSILFNGLRLFRFRSVQKMGEAFGVFIYSIVRLRRGLVLSNLRYAFPEKSEEELRSIAKASYRNLFATYFEILYMDKLSKEDLKRMISFPDSTKVDAIMKRNKGLIILSGHYGSWELLALSVPVFSVHSYTVIVQKQRNPHVNQFMTDMRSRFGSKIVMMERALRESLRALSNNGIVALIADQSGPESGIYTEFFGRPASTHQGPAVFQVRSGAPMIMALLVREGWEKFRIEFEEIDTSGVSGTDEEKMQQITQRHVSVLERHIRQHPEQWLWMHKRWKHTDSFLKKRSMPKEPAR